MEVDLFQLPIPNWGLVCPTCGYLLNGLPSHRCPECGTEFDVASIVPTYARLREPRFTGHELPLPDFGLTCAKCGAPLSGAVSRACPRCGAAFDPEALRPSGEWFPADTSLRGDRVTQLLLDEAYIPYVAREEQNAFTGQLGLSLFVSSEFYFEFLWLTGQGAGQLGSTGNSLPNCPWSCPSCAERNPPNFEVCWNCRHPRGS